MIGDRKAFRLSDTSRPALILDGQAQGDVGLARSLGFFGIPVHVLTPNPRSPASGSRYVSGVHAFPERGATDDEKIARLRSVAQQFDEKPILLHSGDSYLRLASERRSELEDVLDQDLAPLPLLRACMEKDGFAALSRDRGFPVPESFVPGNAAELEARADELEYPVFVKPVYRARWAALPAGIVSDPKGTVAESAVELVALFRRLEAEGTGAEEAVIQRLIRGIDADHMSVHLYRDPAGRVFGPFSARKYRVWPPRYGAGSLIRSEAITRPACIAVELVEAIGYTGFTSVQFKHDRERDEYLILEMNCRYSSWVELPSRCGCNFPAVAYATVTRQEAPPVAHREGPVWLDFWHDLDSFITYRRAGEATWPGYVRSLRGVRCWAYFAWDDPRPFFRKLRKGM